jgi:hypothetical protein
LQDSGELCSQSLTVLISGGRISTSRNNTTGMIVCEVLENGAVVRIAVDGCISIAVNGRTVLVNAVGEVREGVRT